MLPHRTHACALPVFKAVRSARSARASTKPETRLRAVAPFPAPGGSWGRGEGGEGVELGGRGKKLARPTRRVLDKKPPCPRSAP
jgi:hypothetical protein